MWESPIYKFDKRVYDDNGQASVQEIVVNVTGSAPTMKVPGDYLTGVFNILTKNKTPKRTKILDVGAAKLRNTLYLLGKGFQLYAVEFPEVYSKMKQAETNLELAEKYPNFNRLIFPKDFFQLDVKIDIALLINVINVMPIPEERLILLTLCREKMREKGMLLWYNRRDIASNPQPYTERTKLNDGYFKGKGRKLKTFHGEWNKNHVHEMLTSTGFSRNEELKLRKVGNNQAFVFDADERILLNKCLELGEITKGGKKRDPDSIIHETEKLFFPELYLRELKSIRPGNTEATKFHRVSARLFATIFEHELKNPIIEAEISEGRGRIDIRFRNKNKPGFFKNLKELRDIMCPTIPVECKNYTKDQENPEFDQLSGRLSKRRGMFGILVCRKVIHKTKTIKHCQDKLDKEEYIIVLDDDDMEKLASLKKDEGNEAVDEYMDKKLDEVID